MKFQQILIFFFYNQINETILLAAKILTPIIDPLISSGGKYSESCWNNNFQACITVSYIIFSIDGGAEVTCNKCIDNSSNSFLISHELHTHVQSGRAIITAWSRQKCLLHTYI